MLQMVSEPITILVPSGGIVMASTLWKWGGKLQAPCVAERGKVTSARRRTPLGVDDGKENRQ